MEHTNPFTKKSTFKIPKSIGYRRVNNTLLIVNTQTGKLAKTENETSIMIWEMILAGKTISEILQKILTTYQIDQQQCADDLTNFLQELLAQNFVQRTDQE